MDVNVTKVEINGHEIECDFLDADLLDAYEDACDVLIQRGNECRQKTARGEYTRASDGIRDQCAALEEFVDAIFGTGTSAKVFDGVHGNLRNHEAAIQKIIAATKSAGKEINDMNNRTAQTLVSQAKRQQSVQFHQYAGQKAGQKSGNRSQRRHNKNR